MGPDGLVTTNLVYGALPPLPIATAKLPKKQASMKALSCARAEMEQITLEGRINRALRSKILPESRYFIQRGELVRVYREEANRWIGSVQMIKVERKMVHVTDGPNIKQFNIIQLTWMKANNPVIDQDIDWIYKNIDQVTSSEK